jgi:hypothetical protein
MAISRHQRHIALHDTNHYRLFTLTIDGWSQDSVIGWDRPPRCWWAQLWLEHSATQDPDIWIPNAGRSLTQLAHLIAERTGLPFETTQQAISHAITRPPSANSQSDNRITLRSPR